ncbi:MAG: glycosyltransferase family 2 protein [Oscillospiraceae bacterium]|nr:glycosyltransferase family 2 protein [Oscillospiraceae bacterium]
MAKITVIVTSFENAEGLKYTLESLCEQTDEDFDVFIVQSGENEGNVSLIKSYCDEYVGFAYSLEREGLLIPEARNIGVSQTNGEYMLFMLEGDYLSPESIEKFKENINETKADILCPRLYISGECEPYYLDWADMLATVPHIGKFDEALLNTLDINGRVYKRKFFDLYSLKFPEQPAFYNTAFLSECVFKCDASLSGVAGAIYDDKSGVFLNGFKDGAEPNGKNLSAATELFDGIVNTVKTFIEEETGSFEGDEYTFQEILFVYFTVLTDRFYRYFWYLSNEDILRLKEKYEQISELMTEERRAKIPKAFADIRFPSMYMSREDAAALPMISLLLDFDDYISLPEFINSLYIGRFPFFEVFVKQSAEENIPKARKNAENLHILPDAGFFAAARKLAVGVQINVKSSEPLDPKILSELAVSQAPKSVLQYIFASKRKKYSAKTYLKKKGMSMH